MTAQAQQSPTDAPDPIQAAHDNLERIRGLVQYPDADTHSGLSALIEQLDFIRQRADRCVDESVAALGRLHRQEAALVPKTRKAVPTEGATVEAPPDQPAPDAETVTIAESPELLAIRTNLAVERARLEAREATCRLLELNAEELGAELIRREQRLLASALLVRDAHLFTVLRENINNADQWPIAGEKVLRLLSGVDELGWERASGLLAISLAAGLLGARWRRAPLRITKAPDPVPFATSLGIGLRTVLKRNAPLLLVLLAINGYLAALDLLFGFQIASTPIFAKLAFGALLLLLLAMTARLLLDPPAPARPLVNVTEGAGRPVARLLQLLALLFLVGLLLRTLGDLSILDLSMLLLLADVYVLLLALNAMALLHHVGIDSRGAERLWKRVLPFTVVLAVLLSTWLGYRELARLLFWGSVGTALGLLVALLLSRLVDDLQDGFDEGRYGWQRSVRRAIGLEASEPVPGLGWLTLLVQIALWGMFALYLLDVWGLPQQLVQIAGRLFAEGVEIGSVNIVPSRIVWAIVSLLLAMMVIRWLQAQLDRRWLVRTRMERGAREAVVTSFGYAAITAAVLLTLSMAGIDFSNLAIIAGALSVGIGFGLQNVVNNFVSGLIMLFERPVKTGDWIVVGATEGYVRRISIRTTTIETFDRSEVIVPNSDLISNQVTNWMHNNNYGRFKIPVGVAYGSDTEKVRDLLLGVANEHPQVVRGFPSWPDPSVLFIGFGDSALNFELRGILYSVDMRMRTISDLNFAIDRVFRDNGIEIPFPQRVIHMADAGPKPTANDLTVDEGNPPGQPDRPADP
jgi:small-conductance mechanosensitive channel